MYPWRTLASKNTTLTKSTLLPVLEPNAFATELISARAAKGFTQSQLATASGVSLSAIKAYEAGRNMPGTRELRELCAALQTSPNKLLFGTETPFFEKNGVDVLLDSEPESEHVARARASLLLGFLSSDERKAVQTLLKSLAIARHGEAKVKEVLQSADFLVGFGRGLLQSAKDAEGRPLSPEKISRFADDLEGFMERQGHVSNLEKLPKK